MLERREWREGYLAERMRDEILLDQIVIDTEGECIRPNQCPVGNRVSRTPARLWRTFAHQLRGTYRRRRIY